MEDRCANSEALSKYQDKLKKQEISYEMFLDSIEDEILEIEDLIKLIKKRASNYDGYDFSEEITEYLKEVL